MARRSNQTKLAFVRQEVTFLWVVGEALSGPEPVTGLAAVTAEVVALEEFGVLLGHTAAPRQGHTPSPGVMALLIIDHRCSPGEALVTAHAARTKWGFSTAPSWGLWSLPPILPGQESW